MIVGAYTLDLYCDLPCNHGYGDAVVVPDQYVADTGPRCRQQARRDGWRFNLRERLAVCPRCADKGYSILDALEARDREKWEKNGD